MSLPRSSTQPMQAAPVTQQNCRALKFNRDNPEELLWYIEDVEFCLNTAGITDVAEALRKYADFITMRDIYL